MTDHVLLVADGLRADVAFRGFDRLGGTLVMPEMHERVFGRRAQEGSVIWGLSMADAPTESRPNHVAMLAGFPEELSNVWNAWKSNGRPFDHLLKRASVAYGWGESGVVDHFEGPDHVHLETFPNYLPGLTEDPSELDQWTLKKYKELLASQREQEDSGKAFRKRDGMVIFMHLAGIDTSGHRFGSLSPLYEDGARAVDRLVTEVERLTREFFKDDKTLYIFTSDHGFPNEGGHGGSDINTRTCPLVVWGRPLGEIKEKHPTVSIQQGQICSFASVMLGLPIPANNIHPLPKELLRPGSDYGFRPLIASYGQLVFELCAQQEEFAETSWLGGMLSRGSCQSGREDLLRLERLKDPLKARTLTEKSLRQIVSKRALLVYLRIFLAGLPLILASISVVFMGDRLAVPLATRLGGGLLLSVAGTLLWYAIGFASWQVSCTIGLPILLLASGSISLNSFTSEVSLGAILGVSLALLLWSNKLYCVVYLLATGRLWRGGAVKAAKFAALGLLLAICSTNWLPRGIIEVLCILGLATSLLQLCGTISEDYPDHHRLLRALPLAGGIFLKATLVLDHFLPRVSLVVILAFLVLQGVFTLWACKSLAGRPLLVWTVVTCYVLVIMASVIDPISSFTIALVHLYWAQLSRGGSAIIRAYQSLDNRSGITRPSAIWAPCEPIISFTLLSFGPRALADITDWRGYRLAPLGEALGISRLIQVPLAAVFGSILLLIFWRLQSSTTGEEIIIRALSLVQRASSIAVLLLVFMVPYKESWIEIVTGIIKIALAALLPLFFLIYTTICLLILKKT